MSGKVNKEWVIDDRTGNLVNIRDAKKEDWLHYKCTDSNCDCRLSVVDGEKKSKHFRHPKGVNCNGGSSESILHKLGKECLEELKRLVIPDGYVVFKGSAYSTDEKKIVFTSNLNIEKFLPDTKVKPDAWFEFNGEYYCFEVIVKHDIDRVTRKRYKDFGRKHELYVVTINLSPYVNDISFLTKDDVRTLLQSDKLYTLVLSPKIIRSEDIIEKATTVFKKGYNICPLTYVPICTKNCKSCPFFSHYNGDEMVCLGKMGLIEFNDLFENNTKFNIRSNLTELYKYNVTSDLDVKRQELTKSICSHLGICDDCFTDLELQRTKNCIYLPFLKLCEKDIRDADLVLVCPKCGRIHRIVCPCGGYIKVFINKRKGSHSYNSVFIGCVERLHNLCSSDTLTLFKDSINGDYADELLAIDSLLEWVRGSSKERERVYKVRHSSSE